MWPDRVSNPGPLTYESGALHNLGRSWGISYDFATIPFYLNENQKFWCIAYVNSFIIIKSVLQLREGNKDS